MNTEYSQGDFSLDRGEVLLQGMQQLRDELNKFAEQIHTLGMKAQEVVPLKLRRQPVTKPLNVFAICNYKKNNVSIQTIYNFSLR